MMSNQYYIKGLEGVSIETITECFNKAFSDYSVPIQSTARELQERLTGNGYAPQWSTGVFEEDRLLAFVLHGIKDIGGSFKLYNAGTGAVPTARGQSLTLKQYEYLLPKARQAGCTGVELEVIIDNEPAIHSYKKVGFHISNTLASFKAGTENLAISTPHEILEVEAINWQQVQGFWDWKPSWQHSRNALMANWKLHKSVQVMQAGEVLGYAIFNPESGRMAQFAVSQAHRNRGIGKALFAYAQKACRKTLTVVNVDSRALHTLAFLEKIGFEPLLQQYEMQLTL